MNDIQIIDDFLPKYQQKEFLKFLYDVDLCWNYIHKADTFTENFKENDSGITSYDQFIKILSKSEYNSWFGTIEKNVYKHFNLKIKDIIRMRLVMSIPRPKLANYNYGTPHVDWTIPHKTLIYYGNDSDASTVFFKEFYETQLDYSKKTIETMIEPKQGRAVLFNGLRYHSVQPHSTNNRLLLNVNFIEEAP